MRKTLLAAVAAAAFASHASNGYFSHGYGMKAKGMAGAATATAIDTFGGAVNPAKMVWVGDRIDFGLDVFMPRRSASREGLAGPMAGYNGSSKSGSGGVRHPRLRRHQTAHPPPS